MTTSHPYPEAEIAVRDALRREAVENTAKGHVLFDGQWLDRTEIAAVRRRAIAKATQHSIEVVVVIFIVAMVGMAFLALINLIV